MKMSQLGTVYATKRRRRNGKSIKTTPKEGITKSNPSKRHRERLNAELDLLASLLPFEQNILSKLDRLSILRLSVSYLRIKSYFQVVMHKEKNENGMMSNAVSDENYRTRDFTSYDHSFVLDSEMFLQALNGFIMILTCDGEVFFATHTIESYLGFHQSDIIHQSVYELVHSEDREELQKQLLWNSFLPADLSGIQLTEALVPEKDKLLERSFTVRFRCLLDNTSGFLRLDIRGRVKILHGQNKKNEEPPLALFAFCTPFGPPSLLEIPPKENMFKSKHKLDFSLVSMDHKGKNTLGYSDSELANMGGYDLVHYDDLAYVASAHQERASGMIAYRYQKKDGAWQWLQTSSRLVYKNSKPDFVICTHRQLMEEEGRDLLGKRTMDFKVSYLDAGISSTYFDSDQLIISPNNLNSPSSPTTSQQRANRRYKTQLRDFLSTCRHKRKINNQSTVEQVSPTVSVVDYISGGPPGTAAAAAAVAAAAYTNTINSVYPPSTHFPGSGPDNVYMTAPVHSPNFYPMPDNLFHQYRLQGVSGYYPEYHTSTTASTFVSTNGLIPYDSYGITKEDTMRWHEGGKSYGACSDSNQSHSGSGLVAESNSQELSSLSVEPYLVSDIETASTNDTIPSQTLKPSCQAHLSKNASPVHSLEELVDPCCSTDSTTASAVSTAALSGTKDSIERRKQQVQQYQNHEQHSLQSNHQSNHQRLVHHRHPMPQLPRTEQHSQQPQLVNKNGGHNCKSDEHKITTTSPRSLSPIQCEPPRQTVLMWGTSYINSREGSSTNISSCNSICDNDLPRNNSDGPTSYEYLTVNNFHGCSINNTSNCTVIASSGEHNSTNMANRKPDADATEREMIEKEDDSKSRTITKSSDLAHISLVSCKKETPQPSTTNND
ncbi:uncharacterized protein LOC125952273 isoform X2 [Anopheles darlingi]|uniref:uncharacterized protein LOC125952273 isoform X2 n=1 Tax=Anopheles darlingi TaxID=43151 RepID=UPI00210013E8|nr:uncharacterized protein LOC125952273 isoform X2 [Anopheles darlingi]